MHEHEALVAEGVAVAVAEVTLGCSADVGEDEARRGFGRDAREVYAVPCWDRGGEDAGRGTEGWAGVVADAETVAVVWAPSVLVVVSGRGDVGGGW